MKSHKERAAAMHQKAAAMHEEAAEKARDGGDTDKAAEHFERAARAQENAHTSINGYGNSPFAITAPAPKKSGKALRQAGSRLAKKMF